MSKQLVKDKAPALMSVCSSCKMEIGRAGTMTAWIFKANRCKCAAVNRTVRLVATGSAESFLLRRFFANCLIDQDTRTGKAPH